ncbi:MAG: hypothetical protein J6M02_04160 [Clostridia bacterium]|nr:hypothetical protein [Clostridia bacterium]
MKNLLKNKGILFLLIAVFSLLLVVAFAAEPGSEGDPLISLSYFENKIEQLKTEVTETLTNAIEQTLASKLESMQTDLDKTIQDVKEQAKSTTSGSFELITLAENESLICQTGTEIIIRSGRCAAIATEAGGLSDTTDGKDIPNGEIIQKNHLIIVPKNDGRGIRCEITGAVMIKGSYEKKLEGI